jgi:hypothetical protein
LLNTIIKTGKLIAIFVSVVLIVIFATHAIGRLNNPGPSDAMRVSSYLHDRKMLIGLEVHIRGTIRCETERCGLINDKDDENLGVALNTDELAQKDRTRMNRDCHGGFFAECSAVIIGVTEPSGILIAAKIFW